MNTNTMCRWLSITPFELGIHLVGVLFTLILCAIKSDIPQWNLNYWQILSPCIAAAGLHMYYLMIILVRRIRADYKLKDCFNDLVLPFVEALLILAFVVSLCIKLQKNDDKSPNYGVIFVPVWILLAILFVKSCET